MSVRKANDPQILEGLHEKTNYSKLILPDSQEATGGETPDEEDINEALEFVQDSELVAPLSPSPPPIPPHTKESYILLESVNSLNNHTTPSSNGVGKMKHRRPHVYEEIDLDALPSEKANKTPAVVKPISRSTPDVLTYAELDFRQ